MSSPPKSTKQFIQRAKRDFLCLLSSWRFLFPTKKNYWAFPVHYVQNDFTDNVRPVFEAVKSDPGIKKIIFTRGKSVNISNAQNTEFVNLFSYKALILLSSCRVIFIQNSLNHDYALFSMLNRIILLRRSVTVNLWHGIAIKQLRSALVAKRNAMNAGLKDLIGEQKHYKLIISSSKVDRLVMAASFYPVNVKNIVITGLPRNDYLLLAKSELPPFYIQQLDTVEQLLKGRKLITYAPTFRRNKSSYVFTDEQILTLKKLLDKYNAVLGFRVHYFDSKVQKQFQSLIDGVHFIDVGQQVIPEMSALIRTSEVIITDYSSLFVDAMYLDKKMVCFAYDIDNYIQSENGFYYDFESVFPGQFCLNFDTLIKAVEDELNTSTATHQKDYLFQKKLFFDSIDTKNSERVVSCVKEKTGLPN